MDRARKMAITELDIHRSAHQWIQLHRDEAVVKARQMVQEMRKRGDDEGADKWLRIIVAIGTFGVPPIDTRH